MGLSRPINKEQFILKMQRALGHPYQKIEIHEDQWDDIVNDALMFYTENIEGGQVHKAYALSYNGELKTELEVTNS